MEEKLGAFLLSLIFLSFAISLIPMSYVSYGPIYERKISFDGCKEVNISLEVGSIELLRSNGSDPYAIVRGVQISDLNSGRLVGLMGKLSIYIPEGWRGSFMISMRHGSITLNGVELKEISIYMGSGLVEGDLTVLTRVRVELRRGSVSLALSVPSDSEPKVTLRCMHYVLRYDGKALSGSSFESLLWRGSYPMSIEIRANSAELSLLRFKG
ncbi:MAG: hypothetical protein RMI85_01070 [Candidatus Korarchaeum sp.]|nr:hypothetical protein [Candidatus Korarchaeum sp.]